MRFQYLSPRLSTAPCMHRHLGSISRLPLLVSATSCVHPCMIVSMSNFPLSHLPLSHEFSAGTWLQYLNSPDPLPAFIFGSQNSPCVSQQSFACIFMYLYFVSVSRLHPSSLNNYLFALILFQYRTFPFPYLPVNFLHPFRFIRRLTPLASPPLLTFSFFQYRNFPGISNFLHASCLSI